MDFLLSELRLEEYQDSKLSLEHVMCIMKENEGESSAQTSLPWNFLRKLIALDETARNTMTDDLEDANLIGFSTEDDLFGTTEMSSRMSSNALHPLDVLCALLYSSDSFLQQFIFSKMSMCQFALPLMLPAGENKPCTFLLWPMRNIIKKWRPTSLLSTKGFREENLVNISLPTFSFVRLGNCSLSKSKILNNVLSPSYTHHDFFVHQDIECGYRPRTISEGLLELFWYFPGGSQSSDVFHEPISVMNLRGDIESNQKQFSLLTKVSSAVFIFSEDLQEKHMRMLESCVSDNPNLYFIFSLPNDKRLKDETHKSVGKLITALNLKKKHVLLKDSKMNEAEIVKEIQNLIRGLTKASPKSMTLEDTGEAAKALDIFVDENVGECQRAKKVAKGIVSEIKDVPQYKKQTMTLQGDLWKKITKNEKELCRMRKPGDLNVETYRSELKGEILERRKQQCQQELHDGMKRFLSALTDLPRAEKLYFLKWMAIFLDDIARSNLKELQTEYWKNSTSMLVLKQIDQKMSDSSLGLEHFVREVGQMHEARCFKLNPKAVEQKFSDLPRLAADLLLDGFPLELIDGDASNIPLQWITDVLTELDKKTGGQCRMRVITVLGVQSTGKSTLLNTMFGLQFPVASGRCTRGAFMTLIKVKENFQEELGCEFLLVIDTEGLKAPELDSLEGSYEHDNELATLVVGLSDITVINMAMENITEMKDILQIVVHAFLRMKEIGKKPNCQFVHQNVSDVSAPVMNMRDRNKLLEQLNEMTKTVATIEKKPQYKLFSDVMEYDSGCHHWYIPSLWQGVPPMAPVSAGYSEHITELKQNLLKLIKEKQNMAQTIPQFIKWMEDIWNAVKHENFIFSFRNSLVAIAYDRLSMKYSEREWKFNKLIHEWFTNTETIIKNQSEDTLEDKGKECCIKLEKIIAAEQHKMITWVEDYFKQEKDCVHLIKYKGDFITSAKMFGENLRRSSYEKYNIATQMQKQQHKIKSVCTQYIKEIEHRVSRLMEECRKKQYQLDDAKLEEEFQTMWRDTVKEIGVKSLVKRNVEKDMLLELNTTMRGKGSAVNERLSQIKHLPKSDKKNNGWIETAITIFKRTYSWWKINPSNSRTNEYKVQYILDKCSKYSKKQARRDADYDDTYCKQLLNMIDDLLKEEENIPSELELEIKLKVLGHAATDFQEMHDNFIKKNDPHSQLETLKSEYFNTFMNVFQEKNESQNLAKRICDMCLKPAIIDHIIRNLGIELVDDIMRSEGSETYTSRTFFQYTVLLNLLEENVFRKYVEYSRKYEEFVKSWILEYIRAKYKNFSTIQNKIQSQITEKIKDLLNNPEIWEESKSVDNFLSCFKKYLNSDLVFPQERMKAIIFKNSANTKEFIKNLDNFLTDTNKEIISEMESMDREDILYSVTVKPQDELFKKVFGCGKQCPFCKVPCEAGGEGHKEHFASVHRPNGLGMYRWKHSSVLSHDICTTFVCGNGTFQNSDTNNIPHPFKQYTDYYPDWRIQPDPSIEASDYWKFVLKEFNEQFAREYNAKPADYPKEWDSLTKDMARESLQKTFNMQ